MTPAFDDALADAGVLAILRTQQPTSQVMELVAGAVAGGLRMIEFPLTNTLAHEQIAAAVARFPDLWVGAGTVTAPDEVARVRDAGASFVVSPALDGEVTRAVLDAGDLGYLPGVLTPRDIADAIGQGLTTLKLFPAGVFGPRYLSAVRAPFPGVGFVPTGGVRVDDVSDYLAAGARAVAVGGELFADADSALVEDRVRDMLRAVTGRP